ncbi:MAG: hypothetical protein AB8I08_14325 [Sandaracinaceae bacterium]
MNSRLACFALLSLTGLLATGCDGVRLTDSVDLTFDFNFLRGPSDTLHSPYVAGADFTLFTTNVDRSEENQLVIASADDAILQVRGAGTPGEADAIAVTPGTVDLLVRDLDGNEMHRTPVDVVRADEARLVAHGPRIIGRPALQPENTDELQVLVGGTATFLVEWFADDEALNGHGALTTEHGDGVEAQPRRTHLFEDREWVSFSVLEEGAHEVRLLANGELVRTITLVGVAEDTIDVVRLHGMDETDATTDQELVVYAQAYAADETPIYGVEYEWDLNGFSEPGLGDLFRYRYAPGVSAELCARHGELEGFATVSATEGFVDSTNELGCSVSGSGPGWLGGPIAAGLFALVWTRRRYPRV